MTATDLLGETKNFHDGMGHMDKFDIMCWILGVWITILGIVGVYTLLK